MIIKGLGSYLPDRVLTNKQIEKTVKTSDTWIQDKLGIRERRIAADEVCSSDLALGSSVRALDDASVKASEIDLIIVATSTPDRISPSTACILQEKLGAFNAAAFDINAVCSGFLYGLQLASGLLKSGTYNNILLVATETYSRITDWQSRQCVFFGDGSGAVVLNSGNEESFFDCLLYADGKGKENFTVKAGGSYMPCSLETLSERQHYFKMNGKQVYETGIKVLPAAINKILEKNNMTIDQVDHLVPHQPSINILKETAKIINLPFSKVATSMQVYANTAGASIPVTLDLLRKEKGIQSGSMLLFAAVGSGWTWGSSLIRWTK